MRFLAALLALLGSSCGRRAPPLAPVDWLATPRHYDHQQILGFHEDGTGSFYVFSAQAPREDWPFTFTAGNGTLRLEYEDGPTRNLEHRIERGEWRFRVPLPTRPPTFAEERFGCRLHLDKDASPYDDSTTELDYYACRITP